MSPSVKAMRERITNQKRKNNTKKDTYVVPVELYEGVEAMVRTNNKRVRYNDLKAYLSDMFNTGSNYNPPKGSIIKLTDYCDVDFDLLFEDNIIVNKNNAVIEEKIFALV